MPIFNFSAGPAMLPSSVLSQIERDLKGWHKGISIMELSHRIPEVMAMAAQARDNIRDLLKIPSNFKILFMQGGARTQFSGIPLNLLGQNIPNAQANYLITGHWSSQASLEAQRYGKINTITDSNAVFDAQDAAYIHFTDNETIDGIELPAFPICHSDLKASIPFVVDATSSILSKAIDFKNVGLVYAATQKNIGIAGLTLVILRDDLIGKAHPLTPKMLDYSEMDRADSMINTPPVFCWYVMSLVLQWVQSQGGVSAMEQRALEKSKLLYNTIDNSHLYSNTIDTTLRSRLNIPFRLPTLELENHFLNEANKQGLYYLKGHKVLGGIRASVYNAMPLEGVSALVEFMKQFELEHAQ